MFSRCLPAAVAFVLTIGPEATIAQQAAQTAVDQAVDAVHLLRKGRLTRFRNAVSADPSLLNLRGPEGATPFMYAAVYADAATLTWLLQRGADPNRRSDAKATALMWAVDDLAKTRALVEGGADVNARSDNGGTPLLIAAMRQGSAPIVGYLLERGANPNPPIRSPRDRTPLGAAASTGEVETMRLLIARGASISAAGSEALVQSIVVGCRECFDLIADACTVREFGQALLGVAVFGDATIIGDLLDRGADINARDSKGRTALILASSSNQLPLDGVRLLADRGASLNERTDMGMTALDYARLHGDTSIVSFLVARGAVAGRVEQAMPTGIVLGNTVRAAVRRSLPILQRADANLVKNTRCLSCHNHSLTALTVAAARAQGFKVDEPAASQHAAQSAESAARWGERLLEGIADDGGAGPTSGILLGLHAAGHPPDLTTDAAVRYLRLRQSFDGRWNGGPACARPPMCSTDIAHTATSMRALQLYAPEPFKSGHVESVRLATEWLARARATTNEARAFRLLGLAWAATKKDAVRVAIRELAENQRADGGWSDSPTLGSTAFATGLALAALREAGVAVSDAVYRKGVAYLLKTQLADGSWHVKSRSVPSQECLDDGFPHGPDRWLSTAATHWATMALAYAAPSDVTPSAGRW